MIPEMDHMCMSGEELSLEQKVDEIFKILKEAQASHMNSNGAGVGRSIPPGVMQDSTYNSNTSTYDGQQPTAQYNGGSL